MDRRQFLSAVSILGSGGVIASSTETRDQAAPAPLTPNTKIHEPEVAVGHELKVGIVAIGSAGGWILSRLNGKLPRLFRSVAADTNQLLLHRVTADRKVLLGSGSSNSAEPASGEIASALQGVDQLFILTDMCGAIETEVASVVAKIARHAQIMTVGAVIDSLGSGGACAHQVAKDGVERLVQQGVPMISLSRRRYGSKNLGVFGSAPARMQAATAFERLYRSTVVTQEGSGQSLVSLDREDVQSVFSQRGNATMVVGYGSASGPDSSHLASHRAISHPLFNADQERSDIDLLVSIEARPSWLLKLGEVNRAMRVIRDAFPYCLLIVGAFRNPLLNDDFHVTVVAPEAPWTEHLGWEAAIG